jgi:hypothetical protein
MNEKIETFQTSKKTAISNDIVLSELPNNRLIFRPMVIEDNPKDINAGVNGTLLYQRKSKNEEWVDYESKDRRSVKTGEEVRIPLHSLELKILVEKVAELNQVVHEHGIASGHAEYVKVSPRLKDFSEADLDELLILLNDNVTDGSKILMKVLKWITSTPDPEKILERFEAGELSNLRELETLENIHSLNQVLDEWKKNNERTDESYWHDLLVRNPFLLNLLFHHPVAIVKDKAYVGGKSLDNTGGNFPDFLLRNRITQNAVIVEIKTPITKLMGEKYRNNSYKPSNELTGGIVQLLNSKDSFTKNIYSLRGKDSNVPEPFDLDCILVIGNVSKELLMDKEKLNSFELFRAQLARLRVVTFDELFEKAELILKAFKVSAKTK